MVPTPNPPAPDPFRLDGRVAIVTGASRGIGLAVAVEMARAGARGIVLAARTRAPLDDARHLIEEAGAACLTVVADVTDEADVDALVEAAVERFGDIDVLVNNAGGAPFRGSLVESRPPGWRKMIELNLVSAYLVSRSVARRWTEPRKGRCIVNVGSTASIRGYHDLSYYSAAKHGLVGLTRSLARDLASVGIRVNIVCPHFVETPMSRGYLEGPEAAAKLAAIPLGRWGELNEVARVVRFAASDAASYMTGAVLMVDGGWSA